jgi:hypothetical protein
VRTNHLSLVTHEHLDTTSEKSNASSPYGPVRAGLTTTQKTDTDHQLLELLNSLENVVENLNYKSFTAYDTLTIAIEAVRVALSATQADEGGTR